MSEGGGLHCKNDKQRNAFPDPVFHSIIATLGSNLDSESKLCYEDLDSESMVLCVSLSPHIMSVPT